MPFHKNGTYSTLDIDSTEIGRYWANTSNLYY